MALYKQSSMKIEKEEPHYQGKKKRLGSSASKVHEKFINLTTPIVQIKSTEVGRVKAYSGVIIEQK